MAISVLGIGIPATHSVVPWVARWPLQRSLNIMEDSMKASGYDWKMLYITPEEPFDGVTQALREKKWDIVMVGRGVRTIDSMVPFLERIVNAVRDESPGAKFCFNESIEGTKASVDRVAKTIEGKSKV